MEMVDSMDDFYHRAHFQGHTHFPNCEMLDARIASALNKIIQHSYFMKEVSLEEQKAQKEDRFLRGSRIAYMIYDYFQVNGRFGGRIKIIAINDFPNFEMLDARIASALNKIIQHSYFKKKVSLEEQKAHKEDRFLRGRQIGQMIYGCFRVTGAHDTVLGYADVFSITLRNDDVQDFDTGWDEFCCG